MPAFLRKLLVAYRPLAGRGMLIDGLPPAAATLPPGAKRHRVVIALHDDIRPRQARPRQRLAALAAGWLPMDGR